MSDSTGRRRRPRRSRLETASCVLALAGVAGACSSDAMGPDAAALSVAGTWIYDAPMLTGSVFDEAITCRYNLEMDLQESGTSFSGFYRRARLFCLLFGVDQVVDAGEGDIVDGVLTGSDVVFNVDSDGIQNTGTVSGNSMTGQVEVTLVVQHMTATDTALVIGAWSATR